MVPRRPRQRFHLLICTLMSTSRCSSSVWRALSGYGDRLHDRGEGGTKDPTDAHVGVGKSEECLPRAVERSSNTRWMNSWTIGLFLPWAENARCMCSDVNIPSAVRTLFMRLVLGPHRFIAAKMAMAHIRRLFFGYWRSTKCFHFAECTEAHLLQHCHRSQLYVLTLLAACTT